MIYPTPAMMVGAALLAAALASGSVRTERHDTAPAAAAAAVSVEQIFAQANAGGESTPNPDGSVTMESPNIEVIVARINADGTVEQACVNTRDAARRFLDAAPKPSDIPVPVKVNQP